MQLSAIVWREHDPDHATLDNDSELLVTIGFVHRATDNVLLITAMPDGQLTMSYGKIKDPPHATHLLGAFTEAGGLEIHEPRPLINEQEPTP